MKHLKSYENLYKSLDKGVWVVFNVRIKGEENYLGQITSLIKKSDKILCNVKVGNGFDFFVVADYQIQFSSPDKESCEAFLDAKKYNL